MEKWKQIKGFEDYEVSTLGRVVSLKRKDRVVLSTHRTRDGYVRVQLRSNGKRSDKYIHKLVAEAFLNHIPCGMEEVVDHIDHDKENNSVENLRLISNEENSSKKSKESSSSYMGVYLSSGKWRARKRVDGKQIHLGCFNTEEEAKSAYDNYKD